METTATHPHGSTAALAPIRFETEPSRYRHWRLSFEGPVARLAMDVQEELGLRPGYILKLNSYDLGVDLDRFHVKKMNEQHCKNVRLNPIMPLMEYSPHSDRFLPMCCTFR